MGQSIPIGVEEVVITDQLFVRPAPRPDHLTEKMALHDLARQMSEHPGQVIPRLVSLAMEICDADSAGVSLYDAQSHEFRWHALHGTLASFEGASTPRDFSPCGICLDRLKPVLMGRPERVYGWIRDAGITIPEVLLVPLFVGGEAVGTLWIISEDEQKFDGEHARVMTQIAAFAGIALHMVEAERKLKAALAEQEILTREMSHRVKNVFAITGGLIRTSARGSQTKDQFANSLSGRLGALADAHALVRRSFASGNELEQASLVALVRRILLPYDGDMTIAGPDVSLGERSTNNLALVLHELATNALKYGAFSHAGSLVVAWTVEDHTLVISWTESGVPNVTSPTTQGFGSVLIKSALAAHCGEISRDWKNDGVTITIRAAFDTLSN